MVKYFGVVYIACNVCDARVFVRRLSLVVLLGTATSKEGSTSAYRCDRNEVVGLMCYVKFI